MRSFILLVAMAVAFLACGIPATADEKVNFNRDIRPILSDNCFQCHGPDEKKREGGLRLDAREHALKGGESGEAGILTDDPAKSALLRRVVSTNADERMPPKSTGKTLTKQQIALLERWIKEGAEYEGHWSFQRVERPAVPEVTERGWSQHPIDRFLYARLQKEKLAPSPEATKEILLRRLSLDLIGLPPTPAEIDAFLKDDSPQAYEKQVDRLLASPHYGERMALMWLDFARYADSNGFQTDGSRYMWPWRDWVIHAFNNNLPFDQFTVEQLAGDLLPQPTSQQLLATGFNRNHRINGEGGIIAEEWRVENIIDRVETVGQTWLGLTFNCCRCHDHKYDPLSQKEFYQLFAYFNNVPESGTITGPNNRRGANSDPVMRLATPEQDIQLQEKRAALAVAEGRLNDAKKDLPQLIAAWEAKFQSQRQQTDAVWTPLEPKAVKSIGGSKLTRQSDGSWLAGGKNPPHDVYTVEVPVEPGQVTGLKLETFPDESLPNQSLGRHTNGNFVLSAVECEVVVPGAEKNDPPKTTAAKIAAAEASYSQNGWEIGLLLDDSAKNGWAVDGPSRKDPTQAMFLFAQPLEVPAKGTLVETAAHQHAPE
jgi:mono/diheme cytochrome c family protein